MGARAPKRVQVMAVVEIREENLAGRGLQSGQMSHLVRHKKRKLLPSHTFPGL